MLRTNTCICVIYRSPTTQCASDLDFDISRSPKVKSDGAVGHTTYDSLLVYNGNIWLASLQDIRLQILGNLTLTFQGHLGSNLMVPLDSPYMFSY